MKHQVALRVTSVLAVLLLTVHLAGDVVYGMDSVGGDFAKSDGALFFIWTLIALGVTGVVAFILSLQGLWALRRSPRRPEQTA